MTRVRRAALEVEDILARFVEEQALPGSGVTAETFWAGFSDLVHTMGPINRALLIRREELQAQIDALTGTQTVSATYHYPHISHPV